MSASTKARDWEVMGIYRQGAGAIFGAGLWAFKFRSRQANEDALVIYIGCGFWFAGSLFGVKIPNLPGHNLYERLYCPSPFSLNDLDLASGALIMLGASAVVGYSSMQISAAQSGSNLFFKQSCKGYEGSLGMGINFMETTGFWKVL